MRYLEEYVNWLKDENQALYDELGKREREIENLRKRIREYEIQEEALKEAESLKAKAESYDRLLGYFNEWHGIYDA